LNSSLPKGQGIKILSRLKSKTRGSSRHLAPFDVTALHGRLQYFIAQDLLPRPLGWGNKKIRYKEKATPLAPAFRPGTAKQNLPGFSPVIQCHWMGQEFHKKIKSLD